MRLRDRALISTDGHSTFGATLGQAAREGDSTPQCQPSLIGVNARAAYFAADKKLPVARQTNRPPWVDQVVTTQFVGNQLLDLRCSLALRIDLSNKGISKTARVS